MAISLAFITPTAYLERFSAQGDIYLALAHLIDDDGKNEYATFHRREAKRGRRVILDNGLFEGAQVDTEALLRRARAIDASVVCAPDVLYHSDATIKAFKQFVRAKEEFGLCIDVMGIPQADNPADWWDCFRFFDLNAACSLIGLSILSIPRAFNEVHGFTGITAARMFIIRQLAVHENLVGRRHTPCHLLGLGDSLSDITLANRLLAGTVVSNDSSSAFVHGANKVTYSRLGTLKGGKNLKKLDFDLPPNAIDNEAGASIQRNINIAKQLAHINWS